MSVGINRRGQAGLVSHLRGVVLAAFATLALALACTGLFPSVPAQARTTAHASAASWTRRAVRLRMTAWRFATRQRGKPYIWGGTGPAGFDCSGLVYAAYRAAGVILPRTTTEMLGSWRLVRIPKSRARRGDLAFFGTGHVELYEWGHWTLGAATTGTQIGFHAMNVFWHPTMYFRVRVGHR